MRKTIFTTTTVVEIDIIPDVTVAVPLVTYWADVENAHQSNCTCDSCDGEKA